MSRPRDIQQVRTALITGASSGIGATFACKLASPKTNPVRVAHREARLASLASELQRQFQVNAEVLVANLSSATRVECAENFG